MDTGKYRKLVLTGKICGPYPSAPGLGRIHVIGLEIVYLLMYFRTRSTRPRFPTKRYNGTPLAVLGPYSTFRHCPTEVEISPFEIESREVQIIEMN